MQSVTLNTISSLASIAFSSLALIMGLLLAVVKLLPEEIGLPLFMILLPCTLIFATMSILLGGLSSTSEQKSLPLMGLSLGCVALLTIVLSIYG